MASIKLVEVDGPAFADEDGAYGQWFAEHDCAAAAIREDFHVWGTAEARTDELDALLRGFIAPAGLPRQAALREAIAA